MANTPLKHGLPCGGNGLLAGSTTAGSCLGCLGNGSFSEQLALAKGRGDERVRVWRIDPIEGPWGGDYQPTASGQAALARHLASELRQLTGW